jgi:hypothetical protein
VTILTGTTSLWSGILALAAIAFLARLRRRRRQRRRWDEEDRVEPEPDSGTLSSNGS